MKVCQKCGAVYDDEVVFCKECGEKLVDRCVCPKCGKEISKDDKFCGSCGYCLKESVSKDETSLSHEKSTKSNELTKRVIGIVLISFFFLVSLFALLGFFGEIVTVEGLGMKEGLSISYFFGDGAEKLSQLKLAYKYLDYYTFELVFFILYNITYFGGLIALLITIGLGIYRGVLCIAKKKSFNKNYFLSIILSSLPYLMFTSFQAMASTNTSLNVHFGWGTSLVLTSIIISTIGYAVSAALEAPKTPKAITARILTSVSLFLMIFVSIYGITSQIGLTYSSSYISVSVDVPIYYYIGELLKAFSNADTFNYVSEIGILIASFALSLVTLLLSYLVIIYLSKSNKGSLSLSIALCSLIFAISLISGILGADSIKKLYLIQTSLGKGTITAMVLSLISIIPLGISLGLRRKE